MNDKMETSLTTFKRFDFKNHILSDHLLRNGGGKKPSPIKAFKITIRGNDV